MSRDPLGVLISVLVSLIVIMLALWAGGAFAHQVSGMSINYPPECCNSAAMSPTGDCAPIDDRYVTEEPDGYHIKPSSRRSPKAEGPRLFGGHSLRIDAPADRQRLPHLSVNEGAHRFCFFPKPGNV